MERLGHVDVLGKRYNIVYQQTIDSNGMLGSMDKKNQRINICIEQGPEQLEDTLLHEILHIIDQELKIGLDEEAVCRLAVGIYSAGYKLTP